MRVKIVVASALLLLFAGLSSPALADIVIGQPAPALAGTQLDGKPFDLSAQHGKVVIINFWARWCAPCREEMPALDSVYRHHKKDLTVIGISMDHGRYRDEVTKIMHAFGYPAALFGDMKPDDFGWPEALPTTYIIDRNGILNTQISATQTPIKEQDLEKMLQPLLPDEHLVDKRR
jgi:cytochrome c biogenesis protein CcmG/thiol:disulfide interchange protein DsbE